MSALAWTQSAGAATTTRRPTWRQTAVAYLYLSPAIVLLCLFHFFPAFYALYISLWRWGIIKEEFIGLQNYQRLLTSWDYWRSFLVTLWYVLLALPAELVLGLLVAYLLFQPIRARGAYRTAYFLPHVTSAVAAAEIWRWIYAPNNGFLNGVLQMMHLPTARWLDEPSGIFKVLLGRFAENNPDMPGYFTLLLGPIHANVPEWLSWPSLALVCVALFSLWNYIGFTVVIYLAGLGNIAKEYYEAARIDGANERQIFRYITLPLLMPTTFFLVVVGTIGALQAFNHIYVMTGGGPLDTTRNVTMLIFKTFYQQTRVGYGSAMAFVLAGFILLLTIFNFRVIGRRVSYD